MQQKTITAKWIGPHLEYIGKDTKGNVIKMGGDDTPPSELLLLGLAGCMGMDIKAVLNKKRIDADNIEVTVVGHQPDTYPKPYKIVDVHFKVTGKNVPPAAVERAIKLSHEKYCIVGQSLQNISEVRTSFEVAEA